MLYKTLSKSILETLKLSVTLLFSFSAFTTVGIISNNPDAIELSFSMYSIKNFLYFISLVALVELFNLTGTVGVALYLRTANMLKDSTVTLRKRTSSTALTT